MVRQNLALKPAYNQSRGLLQGLIWLLHGRHSITANESQCCRTSLYYRPYLMTDMLIQKKTAANKVCRNTQKTTEVNLIQQMT